jgi:hypothetical protein
MSMNDASIIVETRIKKKKKYSNDYIQEGLLKEYRGNPLQNRR